MLRKTPAIAAITALALSAHAAVIIEFKQVGPDVVVTGSGSLNTAGLTYLATQSTPALLLVPEGIVLVGIPNELDTGYWSGASVTGSLGTGAASPSNGTGDRIGVYLDYVCLPDGYVSGTSLSALSTFSMGSALLAEYEELLHRESLWRGVPVSAMEREALLDDFCAAASWQSVYFRWRPNLPDPADDHVLELAIAGGGEHLVTHNTRDFGRGELTFTSPKVVTPAQHLKATR